MDVRITFRPRARTMLSCGTCYTAKRKVLEVAHVTLATVLTISRAAAILGDFLLVVITARSLWRRPLRERLAEMKRVSFARVLLWNGQYPHLKHRSCVHGTTKFLSDRDDILRVSYVQQTVTTNPHIAEERGLVVDDSGVNEEDKSVPMHTFTVPYTYSY